MMKIIGWLCKMVVTVTITAAISALTTLFVMNLYMKQLLQPLGAIFPANPLSISELASEWAKELQGAGLPGLSSKAQEENVKPKPAPGTAESSGPSDAVSVWAQNGAGANREKVVISADEFQKRREKLTDADKDTVFSMLLSRIPQEEVQRISADLEDGLTAAELEEIKRIAEQYLQPEEFDKLMGIVNK
ncbi:MAG: hypothetical protein K0Q59_3721 [Paenibacillus sp.]|nr:hypothetical protein [Paenibacillus sp.]